mgnify:CR=1 FL=1
MRLDEIANSGFKQNRNVKYEKPPKTNVHEDHYHYPSGAGSVSPIQKETESKKLIDQPENFRTYHYASGDGKAMLSPIRKENKYIVGGRTERKRDVIDIDEGQKKVIRDYVKARIIRDVPETATGEMRDFVKDYTKDTNLAGSINNNGKAPKEYSRFIRPAERLKNQSVSTNDDAETQNGNREYHYPSGAGFKSPTGGKVSPDAERGYHYPSGKGEKSPLIGKTISGRTARGG